MMDYPRDEEGEHHFWSEISSRNPGEIISEQKKAFARLNRFKSVC